MTRAVRRIHRWRETGTRCDNWRRSMDRVLVVWLRQWQCEACGATTWTDGTRPDSGACTGAA